MSTVLEAAKDAIFKVFPEYNVKTENSIIKRKIRKLCRIFIAGVKYNQETSNNPSQKWHSRDEVPENYTTIIYECYDSSIQVKYLFDTASYLMAKNVMKRWAYLHEILPQ